MADAHWGKAAAFRASGVPLGDAPLRADLERLHRALDRSGAQRLVVLGDLIHAAAGRTPEVLAAVAAWRAAHPDLPVTLVRGNHDRHAGDPPAGWRIRVIEEGTAAGPFVLSHQPVSSPAGYVLAGHLHPGVRLEGPGGQRLRQPCFHIRPDCAVLPAFSRFTAANPITPRAGDRIYAVADDQVVAVYP
ncbi:MAG: ligase-associated DNA damage response endonuclease PdeM [Anaerolineae bacterium]